MGWWNELEYGVGFVYGLKENFRHPPLPPQPPPLREPRLRVLLRGLHGVSLPGPHPGRAAGNAGGEGRGGLGGDAGGGGGNEVQRDGGEANNTFIFSKF